MLKRKLVFKEYESSSGTHDRLRSVKFSRSMRNISLALGAALFIMFFLLLFGSLLRNLPFMPLSLIYLALALFFAWLAWHYHGRFRNRD